ncbi:glycosyltransferase [Synechococcus sp. PCC 7502]|uniref:glycosyltransferase family 4 protein n=1 Tax=Synechococcus sp. PCC 7502 TaxID=1173263 RepID=UPI00029FA024|nr:glycosyltransferase family 4 protein [Synechococcus sp. PCC 7502]AFY75242.1 glycosyltransferase [Synechococcus sp. PCC 7502]
MKILVLAWEFPPRIIGGISRHVAELYPEIVLLHHEVHLITVEVEGIANFELVNGIYVHRVPVKYDRDFFNWVSNMNFAMNLYLIKLLDSTDQEFQIIHAHDWLVADAAIAVAEKFNIALVATIHATEYGRYNGIHNDTQRYIHSKETWLATRATRVIVCTNYMRAEITRVFNCDDTKIDVVYNGLSQERLFKFQNLDFDKAQLRTKFAESHEQIVYYVGRITYEKGIFLLINAATRVIPALKGNVKFVIIGSGDTDSLKQQAWNLGIAHKVIFTGFMSDTELTKFQTIADCAVFPSLYEPFGIVALESFATKVPVVVSNTGGFPEVVRNGETGIVTIANNSESLANGIIEILQNPEYSAKLAAQAFKELQERWSWVPLAAQTVAVYLNALANTS